jgi:hypothetical protein
MSWMVSFFWRSIVEVLIEMRYIKKYDDLKKWTLLRNKI